MPLISAITTCKGRLAHLKQTLPPLMRLGLEVIVVDYDCPDGAGAWVRETYPRARVVAVSDRPTFNAAAARNLGAAQATGDWLFFVDADALVAPELIAAAEPQLNDPNVFLMLPEPRDHDLYGAIILSRVWFDALGGYDEAFEGWGAEDVDLIERLQIRGVREGALPTAGLTPIAHTDAERTRFHAIADVTVTSTINSLYRMAKNDLARHGQWLEAADRVRLYASIRDALLAAKGVRAIQLPVRASGLPRFDVFVTLNYEIKAKPEPVNRPPRTKPGGGAPSA